VRHGEVRNYERLSPLGRTPHWAAFTAKAEDGSLVELRLFDESLAAADVRRIFRRMQLVVIIQHPGVRSILEVAESHQPLFAVVELLTGESLSRRQQHSPVTPAETLQLGMQLSEAMAEAHRFGINTGVLSTDVIVERHRGEWTIDLSHAVNPHSGSSSAMSPERRTEFSEKLDAERDVVALAWLLRKLASSHPVDPSKDGPQVFERLDRACQLAEEQPVSAGEFAKRLRAVHDTIVASGGACLSGTVAPETDFPYTNATLVGKQAGGRSGIVDMPKQLGRFKILDRLGSGAVGVVFRATDLSNGEIVAIKVLNSQLARNPLVVRRFAKEARLLARIENAWIANILDFNSDQGFHFLAIEFVAGGALTDVIKAGRQIPERQALRLILDVSRGLAAAHQQEVFHRDVKPDNILLTAAGVDFMRMESDTDSDPGETNLPLAKLADFGLARTDQQSESLAITHDGTILGTPLYMAPEQCRGLSADARSDVYSLGATLFHLLAGRPPFQGENHIAVMNAQCGDPLPSLSRLCPGISDGCVSVVEKCLAKTPDARYQDVESLQSDLERLLHGESTSLVLHPAAPETHGAEVLEFRFSCDLRSSPAQLWPYISNTDRVNHAMGLSTVTYTTRTDPVRGVERFAETRIAGQKLQWQEHPYEWIEGRRLSILREFSGGPFHWFMNIIELMPASGGGTRLTQTLRVVPRNWIGRLIARFQMGRSAPHAFRRVYSQIDNYQVQGVAGDASADPFASKAALTKAGRARLEQRLSRLVERHIEPDVIETLRQLIEHASDLEVARIRPLVFAERFQLNPEQVIDACLTGAKQGLLILLWDILCPSCRIPADVQETLATLQEHAYCPSCDLRYEVDFANSVELIFRAHPDVRSAETRTYCIGGPAFSAHVVAQVRLAIGERIELELALNEGSYRVRGPQLPFSVDLRVSAGNGVTRMELPLLRPPLPNTIPPLRQGTQVLALLNNTDRELQIRLERTAGRSMALTAAAAASIPLFREMFPEEILSPGQIVSVTSVTLLMAEICEASRLYVELGDGPAFGRIREDLQQMDDLIRSSGGAIVKIVGEGIVAIFTGSRAALLAAAKMLQPENPASLPRRIAFHCGPALVTTLNDRLDYFGETVHLVRNMLQSAESREFLVSADTLYHDQLLESLDDLNLAHVLADFTVDESATLLFRCRVRENPGTALLARTP